MHRLVMPETVQGCLLLSCVSWFLNMEVFSLVGKGYYLTTVLMLSSYI